jgi:indolepyruvate ferredoxin oxidoreductase beta subunit
METNIVICGVGGQGTVLAAQILGTAAVRAGLAVRVGETHGMAQRGGSVLSHVRIGDVYGPITPEGRGHILLAFEPMEAVRHMGFLTPGATALVNTRPIVPLSVILGQFEYLPVETYIETLQKKAGRVIAFDASQEAIDAGSRQAVNIVLLGALSAFDILPFPEKALESAVLESLPPRLRDVSSEAFRRGAARALGLART